MQILHANAPDFEARWKRLCSRGSDEDESGVRTAVSTIVADVRARGDEALLEYTRRFDGWGPATAADLVAGPKVLAAAWRSLPVAGRKALRIAAARIASFHRRETDSVVPTYRDRLGARLGQVSRPLGRVGLYVPGGTARYPSSVLMTAIPARVAGVGEVVAVSPADRRTGDVDAWTLAACHVSGVSRLFRVGGAQAVAALAHGTATVPAVDKICGPGQRLRGGGQAAGLRHGRHRHDCRAVGGPGPRRRQRPPGRGRRRPAGPGRARRARRGGPGGDERGRGPGHPGRGDAAAGRAAPRGDRPPLHRGAGRHRPGARAFHKP